MADCKFLLNTPAADSDIHRQMGAMNLDIRATVLASVPYLEQAQASAIWSAAS